MGTQNYVKERARSTKYEYNIDEYLETFERGKCELQNEDSEDQFR